jgi:hypothetical protein
MNSKFFFPAWPGQFPDGDGYFGALQAVRARSPKSSDSPARTG